MKVKSNFMGNDTKIKANTIAMVDNNKGIPLDEYLGNLSNLDTSDKSSIVDSINEVNNKGIYDTAEQEIGKWIDNKKIYRKVIDLGSYKLTAGIHDIAIPNTQVDTLINCKYVFKLNNIWYGIFNSIYTIQWKNNTALAINATENVDCQQFYVILEYTKQN